MPPSARSTRRYVAEVAALAPLYWAAVWIGIRYVTIGPRFSLAWPAAGLAVAVEPGAVFIQKPFAPDTIVRVVRERLQSASLPAKPPPGSPPAALDSGTPA